jgi:hypothetical protein
MHQAIGKRREGTVFKSPVVSTFVISAGFIPPEFRTRSQSKVVAPAFCTGLGAGESLPTNYR